MNFGELGPNPAGLLLWLGGEALGVSAIPVTGLPDEAGAENLCTGSWDHH
jgi:hypothetical protein